MCFEGFKKSRDHQIREKVGEIGVESTTAAIVILILLTAIVEHFLVINCDNFVVTTYMIKGIL